MRFSFVLLALAVSGCAVLQTPPAGSSVTLNSADAATSLAVGQQLVMTVTTHPPSNAGEDPVVIMTLRHPDGRVMAFEESNHAPTHVMAQAPGGPLAQTMGLFGDERPTLYGARADDSRGQPFLCAPEGPHSLGYYEAPDGAVQIVGLEQDFQFETRPDGAQDAVPYSPDQVCARLRFTKG